MFEVRIYSPEAGIRKIIEKSHDETDMSKSPIWVEGGKKGGKPYAVDATKISRVLNSLDFSQTRQRRDMYNRLFQEALVIQEPGRGITFNNMLLLLAHYKMIDDDKALK